MEILQSLASHTPDLDDRQEQLGDEKADGHAARNGVQLLSQVLNQ